MMEVGQKVVCVDDKFPSVINKFYTRLPREGVTYVIRDIRIGVRFDGQGDVSVLLVGLVNPKAESRAALERGFSESRFRPLDEMQTSTSTVKEDELVNA